MGTSVQLLSTYPHADGKSGGVFFVHNIFLELNSKTALQHSPKQVM